jgi:hypothetical protein
MAPGHACPAFAAAALTGARRLRKLATPHESMTLGEGMASMVHVGPGPGLSVMHIVRRTRAAFG